jgi:uncharacterized protein
VISRSRAIPVFLRLQPLSIPTSNLEPNLSTIGNVSKSTGILILNGENDSQTPVQQAFLLQQWLTDLNHPDHALITYPNLGHALYPSSQWSTGIGPIQQYALADIYTWLEAHSGFTSPAAAARIPTSSLPSSDSTSK